MSINSNRRAIVLLSGGIDSTVLAYWVKKEGYDVQLMFLDYGQDNARSELFAARRTSRSLKVPIEVVSIPGLKNQFVGFTGPEYRMVSVRHELNCWDLALGLGITSEFAIVAGYSKLFVGNVENDLKWRPRLQEYIKSYESSINLLYDGYMGREGPVLSIEAPLLDKSKTEVIKLGAKLGVEFANTWSCQEKSIKPCGECLGCEERATGFKEARINDDLLKHI
ncbi:7-cyano-7-deazaguanine synthase [Bacillus sp. WP8]|uniref:7-cyano-7-deazaguanine synthase n=1 Tax=Bacillus sp. WP8 TaxID=756828 RepID=UPI00119E17FF|nr:7-cyano-7-deazaguanine synthase [Bacillus sp. WP8]